MLQRARPFLVFPVIFILALSFFVARGTYSPLHPGFFSSPLPTGSFSSRFTTLPNRPYFPPNTQGCASNLTVEAATACDKFPSDLLAGYQIVLKTGAAERNKTKAVISTFGACIPNLLIVSDAPDQIDGHEVIDVLATLEHHADNNEEWTAYEQQKAALIAGETVKKSKAGWKLDRLKFLPMVDEAYRRSTSDTRWYVFLEADNYIFWDNLFRLLEPRDPDQHHYLGTGAAGSGGRRFLYGGGAMVISRGLMQDLLGGDKQPLAVKYEALARNDCCGDAALSYAILEETGVTPGGMYPMFTGEALDSLPVAYSKLCVPVLSLHRVSGPLMRRLWSWERCRPYDESPITYSTILDFTMSNHWNEHYVKQAWDNYASQKEAPLNTSHSSLDACAAACWDDADCLSYSYLPTKCRFSSILQQGKAAPSDGEKSQLVSGWYLDKLASRAKADGLITDPDRGLCNETNWLQPKFFPPP